MILVKEHAYPRFLYIFNFSLQKVSKNAPLPHANWVLSFFPFKFPVWDFYQYPCLRSFEYLTEWVWVSFLVLSIFWNYFENFPFGHLFSFWVYPFLIKLCGPFSYLAYKFFTINILFVFYLSTLCFLLCYCFCFFGFQPCSRIFWNFYLIKISFMSSGLFPYMG